MPITTIHLSYREKTGCGMPLVHFLLLALLEKNKPESKQPKLEKNTLLEHFNTIIMFPYTWIWWAHRL